MNAALPGSSLDTPASQAAFIAAMQTPAAYAALHEVHAPIRLVETHVSWVFLTGRHAYKVKKPLRLSFLDYSTPARRAALCLEELRLNQRHAPGLYLDVVPIGGSPEAPRLGSQQGVFEHALRMRQFEPTGELEQLLQHQAVTASEIATLGTDLARMHASAMPAPVGSDYGRPERVHRVALENFDELRRVLDVPLGEELQPVLDTLRAYLDKAFAAVLPSMELRREAHVRECHGDLHCGNVVRWQGRLVAFDGLEFDPALRFIDVASDLAFLAMDLAMRGRGDLRLALLDAWTTANGDFDAIDLLRYYEPCRALVRAKVATLRGAQSIAAQAEARLRMRGYLDWALAQATRARPWLIVMVGLSGSGKTWLARRLATACGALLVRSDVERKRLAGLGPLVDSRSPADGGLYTREFGERTYARLREGARSCLRGGEHVIVDAANLRRAEREAFAALAREEGAGVRFVHCVAPLATLKTRIAARRAAATDASEATLELLDRQPGYWEPFANDESELVHAVDTTDAREIESTVEDLRQRTRDA